MQDKFIKVLVRKGPEFDGREYAKIAEPEGMRQQNQAWFDHAANGPTWFSRPFEADQS